MEKTSGNERRVGDYEEVTWPALGPCLPPYHGPFQMKNYLSARSAFGRPTNMGLLLRRLEPDEVAHIVVAALDDHVYVTE